jgi:hypothetical protein
VVRVRNSAHAICHGTIQQTITSKQVADIKTSPMSGDTEGW